MAESESREGWAGEGEEEEGWEGDEDEEVKRAYEEWKKDFDEDSEQETDEEEGEEWEERRDYERKETHGEVIEENQDQGDGLSLGASSEREEEACLPAFDIDVNWRFGGHISSVDPYHRHQLAARSSADYSSPKTYSHSLLPSLPLCDFQEDEVLCSPLDISQMILLMLRGCSSDLFSLTSNHFSFTPTGSRIRVAELTSSSLHKLLAWFVDFGNKVEYVRHKIYDPSSELNSMEQDSSQEEPYSTLLHQTIGPITASLRDIFSSFLSVILQLESQIPPPCLEEHEIVPSSCLTFTQLYLQLRPWEKTFDTALLGITQTLCKVAVSRLEPSVISSYFPVLKLEDIKSFEIRDFLNHLHVSCLATDLLGALSHTHIISSHLSTVSPHSSLQTLGKGFSSNQSQRIEPSQVAPLVSFQEACLSCFSALTGSYLKHFFTWIFRSEKVSTNPKLQGNKFYSSQSHFGGLSYDHYMSLLSAQQLALPSASTSWVQYSAEQMVLKFNYFPPLWQPLLAFGAMTKVNIQGLVKQGQARSVRYSLLREFVAAPEKVTLAYHTLLQRSAIQISLPAVSLFAKMIDLNSDEIHDRITSLSPAVSSPSSGMFTSPHSYRSQVLRLTSFASESQLSPSPSSHSLAVLPASFDLCDLFPSVTILQSEFCLQPLSDTLFVSQQHAINTLVGTDPKSYDLIAHLEFARRIFLLGDPLVYHPLYELLLRQNPTLPSASSPSQATNLLRKQHEKLGAEDLFSNIENNIHSHLPRNLTESHVLVSSSGTGSGKENYRLRSSDKHALLFHLLESIHIEIHYLPPLADVFSPDVLAVYNSSLSLLLKLQCCIWSGEILWKQVVSSSSASALQFQGYSSEDTIHTETSFLSFRDVTRSCVAGVHSLLHLLRSLRHFYIHEIHNVCWVTLLDFLSSRRCRCVEDLLLSHENYLLRIQTLLAFQRPKIEEILQKGLKAIQSLEEVNSMLETEQQAARYTKDPDDYSVPLLESKFRQVFKEFGGMMKEIRSFSKSVLDICTRSPIDTSEDFLTSELTYHHANALRMLIGL